MTLYAVLRLEGLFYLDLGHAIWRRDVNEAAVFGIDEAKGIAAFWRKGDMVLSGRRCVAVEVVHVAAFDVQDNDEDVIVLGDVLDPVDELRVSASNAKLAEWEKRRAKVESSARKKKERQEPVEPVPEPHRDAMASDFEGKTIKAVDTSCINIWRFEFTDGSRIAIEVDSFGDGFYGMSICEECAKA